MRYKMTEEQLFDIATRFCDAIITAKANKAFDYKDRMSRFPMGCCDDTADLFAHYLYQKYSVISMKIDGSYHDGNAENNCSHSWLEIDGLIIDLTGSQFKYNPIFLNYDKTVYVGPIDEFHALFEIESQNQIMGIEDLSINCWERMFGLYKIILNYLNK